MKTMSKKSFVEKTEDMKIRAKDLFAAGKQRYGEIRSKPIWGRMRKGIESTAEVVGKGTRRAAEKSAVLARRAGVKYDKYETDHKLQKVLAEFGRIVYDRIQHDPRTLFPNDTAVTDMVEQIREMEKKSAELETKEESIKRAA